MRVLIMVEQRQIQMSVARAEQMSIVRAIGWVRMQTKNEYYEKLAEKNDFSEPVRAIKRMSGVAVSYELIWILEHATQDEPTKVGLLNNSKTPQYPGIAIYFLR